jgi:hypothetical protein
MVLGEEWDQGFYKIRLMLLFIEFKIIVHRKKPNFHTQRVTLTTHFYYTMKLQTLGYNEQNVSLQRCFVRAKFKTIIKI